jgi:hypothetical protein
MASNTTMPNNTMCTLRTKQGDIIVSINAVKESKVIKGMLDCYGDDDGTDANIIPINNITLITMTKVVEYCNYIIENKDFVEKLNEWVKDFDWVKPLDPWFVKYFDIPVESLKALINAANFLDIELLLRISGKQLGGLLKGKTPEELHKFFGTKPKSAAAAAASDSAAAAYDPVVEPADDGEDEESEESEEEEEEEEEEDDGEETDDDAEFNREMDEAMDREMDEAMDREMDEWAEKIRLNCLF